MKHIDPLIPSLPCSLCLTHTHSQHTRLLFFQLTLDETGSVPMETHEYDSVSTKISAYRQVSQTQIDSFPIASRPEVSFLTVRT